MLSWDGEDAVTGHVAGVVAIPLVRMLRNCSGSGTLEPTRCNVHSAVTSTGAQTGIGAHDEPLRIRLSRITLSNR